MTTTYSKEINIYNTDAIQESINEAGTTASNFITEVSADNGIVVATEGHGTTDGAITASTTGWHIGDVLEFLRQGISRFWIGLKNQGDTTPTVRIGKAYNSQASDNESHMELDYHSMQLVDKDGDTYFHVSDLKDTSDTCLVTEVLNVYGNWVTVNSSAIQITPTLSVMHAEVYPGDDAVLSVVNVDAEGVIFSDIDTDGYYINAFWSGGFAEPYTVTVTYETSSKFAKAYTAGLRYDGSGYLGNPGAMSFAEGYGGIAAGFASHIEGVALNTSLHGDLIAGGLASHAEGLNTKSYGGGAHSEGFRTTALGDYSHSEGYSTSATGQSSHSEGADTKASSQYAHAEGSGSVASGAESHAQNQGTKAAKSAQTALGTYNIEDTSSATTHPSGRVSYGQYAAIIGNGTSNNARSNALAVDWNGNVLIAGGVKNMSGTKLYADASHEHSCSDITSGTLADARLPTKGSAGTAGTSSATSGATLAVPYITTDAYGRVTGKGTHTHTIGSLAASAVSSGTFDAARIPTLATSKISGLGTEVEKDISSNVSCANSAYTALGSISLTAGKWVITGCIQYASAANGLRYACISANSGTTAPSALEQRKCADYRVQSSTAYTPRISVTRIVSISATTNYYLKAYQTSGAAINATGNLHAIRIA